jgi:hypothetical protein
MRAQQGQIQGGSGAGNQASWALPTTLFENNSQPGPTLGQSRQQQQHLNGIQESPSLLKAQASPSYEMPLDILLKMLVEIKRTMDGLTMAQRPFAHNPAHQQPNDAQESGNSSVTCHIGSDETFTTYHNPQSKSFSLIFVAHLLTSFIPDHVNARRTKGARFVCVLCNQTFTTNHNLKSKSFSLIFVAHLTSFIPDHLKVHLGLKDHPCTRCRREFTTQSVLQRHLKTCKAPELF